MDKAIETYDLTKKFNRLTAVDKLNISIENGEVFGLLGPNGAGKTTTISMLCTILKPTSGTAKVYGFDIVSQATQVRKSIGIVFQDPSIDDRLTGRENLYMHANLYGVPQSEQKARIDRVLKLVELEDRADDILRTYSSGMRRRCWGSLAKRSAHKKKLVPSDPVNSPLSSRHARPEHGMQGSGTPTRLLPATAFERPRIDAPEPVCASTC